MKSNKTLLITFVSLISVFWVLNPVMTDGWTPTGDYALTQVEEQTRTNSVLINSTTMTDLAGMTISISCDTQSVLQITYSICILKTDGDAFTTRLLVNGVFQENFYTRDSQNGGWATISVSDFYDCTTTATIDIVVQGKKGGASGTGTYIYERRLIIAKYDPVTPAGAEFGSLTIVGLILLISLGVTTPIAFRMGKRKSMSMNE